MTKVSVQIYVADMSLAEVEAFRAKIQVFLDNEPNAQLATFSYTEES